MNADDLLSFKEYSPIHESHSHGGSAEININSPNHQRSPYQNATTTSTQSTINDPIEDLINSMSASVNVLQNDERQRSPSGKFKLIQCIFITLIKCVFCSPSDDIDATPRTNYSIFSIEFYQKFFNVDANVVRERIMSAIVPRRAPVQYMKEDIGSNPDLYGPFWIVVTLVMNKIHIALI